MHICRNTYIYIYNIHNISTVSTVSIYLPTYLPIYLSIYLPTNHIHTYLHTYITTYVHTYIHTFFQVSHYIFMTCSNELTSINGSLNFSRDFFRNASGRCRCSGCGSPGRTCWDSAKNL